MQSNYEKDYELEPYTGPHSLHKCPYCGYRKVFSRYIHKETGEYLADHVGKCTCTWRCAFGNLRKYHMTPKGYFAQQLIQQQLSIPFN